jgi:hypothetical protein
MQAIMGMDEVRAGGLVERLNAAIIKAAARRRQKVGHKAGERAPAGLARAVVELVEIEERGRGGRFDRVTEPGSRTARRPMPRILAGMSRDDPRAIVAERYAIAVEKLGAVKGVSFSTEAASTDRAGVDDGGAAVRAARAAFIRLVHGVANGWAYDKDRRSYVVGGDRLALSPSYRSANRMPIRVTVLIDSVCIEGDTIKDVLAAHGWAMQARHAKKLKECVLDVLEAVAIDLGLMGRPAGRKEH